MTGSTPGLYATRDGEYQVQPDGTIWLIGGTRLPQGAIRIQVESLPGDAAMTEGAMGGPATGGTTPPGRGPDTEQVHSEWGKEKH